MQSSLKADRRRLHGDDVAPADTPPSVAALRPLVAERRYEPPGHGPSAAALSGILDGLDLAVAGVRRLDAVSAPGPQALAPALAPDLDPVFDVLDRACSDLRERIEGRTTPVSESDRTQLSGVDDSLSAALETLRAAHLTPAAGAAELRDLFAAVEALSLVAGGLTRADVALDPAARH